jgi:spore coat polysaccharide biosynthesis protein SpsF (cytidylyltransferase family)
VSEFAKAVFVICTRIDSARVPRKALRKIAGVPAIEHILRRVGAEKAGAGVSLFPVILAVPHGCADYDLLPNRYNVAIYQGSAGSPLHRMADAITWWATDGENAMPKYVIRVTHDDILIDLKTVVELVDEAENQGAGYAITPTIVEGAGVEVIHVANLIHAANKATGDVEHISYFVRGEGLPNEKMISVRPRSEIERPYRLTLDYPEDAVVLETVLRRGTVEGEYVGGLPTVDAICRYLDLHTEILKHNEVPAVSVYICARNAEKWVQDAIRSVPDSCSIGGVELVVVEDGSGDRTLVKILEVADEIDRLIVNEANMGLASSSNVGIRACRGRYVMRLDADDRFKPWMLDAMIRAIQNSRAGVVYAAFDEMNESGGMVTRSGCDPREKHHAGAALMDGRIINEMRFRDGLRHWDGLELYNRLRAANVPIAYVDDSCWFYRRRDDSMSAKMTPERAAVRQAIEGFRP